MTTRTFTYAIGGAIVLVALAAGAWYLFAAPVGDQLMRGRIEGTTSYPSDFVPAQRVCAQSVADAAQTYCVDARESTNGQAPTFSITVPPGRYYVYAMLKDAAGIGSDLGSTKAYYTAYVTCGLNYSCKDHTRIAVPVDAGATVHDVQPYDWYD